MAQPSPAEFAERQSKLHELANKAEGLKEYILSLDIRRQGNREAAGRMRRDPPEEGKVWMTSVRAFPFIDMSFRLQVSLLVHLTPSPNIQTPLNLHHSKARRGEGQDERHKQSQTAPKHLR